MIYVFRLLTCSITGFRKKIVYFGYLLGAAKFLISEVQNIKSSKCYRCFRQQEYQLLELLSVVEFLINIRIFSRECGLFRVVDKALDKNIGSHIGYIEHYS
jgi:hypothetical protein